MASPMPLFVLHRVLVSVACLGVCTGTANAGELDMTAAGGRQATVAKAQNLWVEWRNGLKLCIRNDYVGCRDSMTFFLKATTPDPKKTLQPFRSGARPLEPSAPAFFYVRLIVKNGKCDRVSRTWTPLPDDVPTLQSLVQLMDQAEKQIGDPKLYSVYVTQLSNFREAVERCGHARP
jgi:hypothetical protein